MQFWDELEGKSLAGTYPLNRWLRTEDNAAWFATRYQDEAAIAYVVGITGENDPVIASLEAVSRVQQPNTVRIDRVGRANLEGRDVAYAIQEPTEDNLGDALSERPLTLDETNQIAESLVAGLGALHTAGLLHGQVKATTVLAVGDTIKLRSDCVRRVPAAERDQRDAYAPDVSALGLLLFECLTQRKPVGPDDPAIARLPAPFAAIVHHTIAGGWLLPDVANALRNPSAASAAGAVSVKAKQSNAGAKNAPIRAASAAAAATTTAVATPTFGATRRNEDENEPEKKGSGTRIVALVALVLLLGAVWYFLRGSHAKSADNPATTNLSTLNAAPPAAGDSTAAPAASTPAPVAPAAPATAPTTPSPARPNAPESTAGSTALNTSGATAGGNRVWRVVVFTYGDEARARQRVAFILAKHPDLKPEVFTAAGRGPYLVTVGGPMDHDEAYKLRSHARKEGMARDAYIQNYTH